MPKSGSHASTGGPGGTRGLVYRTRLTRGQLERSLTRVCRSGERLAHEREGGAAGTVTWLTRAIRSLARDGQRRSRISGSARREGWAADTGLTTASRKIQDALVGPRTIFLPPLPCSETSGQRRLELREGDLIPRQIEELGEDGPDLRLIFDHEHRHFFVDRGVAGATSASARSTPSMFIAVLSWVTVELARRVCRVEGQSRCHQRLRTFSTP
jgi:hypothetical protein